MRAALFDNLELGSLLGDLTPESRLWISNAGAVFQDPDANAAKLLVLFSQAATKVKGGNHLEFSQPQELEYKGHPITWKMELNGALELARAFFLLMLPEGKVVPFVQKMLEFGSLEEQVQTMKLLPFLPDASKLEDQVREFLRGNVQPVFEAIALNNPYPVFFFSESGFNQMVLKAAFIGLDIRHIVGLPYRISPNLVSMMEGFVKERDAACRPVNQSIRDLAAGVFKSIE